MDENFVNELSTESSAISTSTHQPIDQLTVEDTANFTTVQAYIDLATALSEAVPPIAPALQRIISPVTKTPNVPIRIRIKETDAEPAPVTIDISQELAQIDMGMNNVIDDSYNIFKACSAEYLRQAQMSYDITRWLVPGLLIFGIVIIVIIVIAELVHNTAIVLPTTIGGGIVEAIGIAKALSKESNNQLSQILKYMLITSHFRDIRHNNETINNAEEKNKAIVELSKEMINFIKSLY